MGRASPAVQYRHTWGESRGREPRGQRGGAVRVMKLREGPRVPEGGASAGHEHEWVLWPGLYGKGGPGKLMKAVEEKNQSEETRQRNSHARETESEGWWQHRGVSGRQQSIGTMKGRPEGQGGAS